MKNKKLKLLTVSLLSAAVIGTSGCGMTREEIIARAAGGVIGAGAAYLTTITPEQERMIGEQMKVQIAQEYKVYTASPELINYVRSIANPIIARSERKNEIPYQVYILESPMINAFAIPGGSIFLTTEILKYMKNEAELAGVLAHEVGHIDLGHTVETIRRAMAAQGIAQGAFSQNDPALVQLVASLTLQLVMNGFSRNQERESDRYAADMLAILSYKTDAMTGFLNTLLEISGGDPGRLMRVFSTHPGSAERIALINDYIEQNNLYPANPKLNTLAFERQIAVLPPKVDLNAAR